MTMENRIYETSAYNIFKRINGNRPVSPGHVNSIIESIKAVGYINNPIIVNGNMEIIDGQHRFEALKTLGMPIRYVFDRTATLDNCMKMNSSSKNWKNSDYIQAYAENGNIDYQWLNVLVQKYKQFDIGIIQEAASKNSSRSLKYIKNGSFKFAGSFDEIDRKLEYMSKFSDLFKEGKLQGRALFFYRVVSFCYDRPEINNERLLEQTHKYFDKFPNISNIRSVLQGMDDVYNYFKKNGKVSIERLYDENIGPARGRKKARNLK